MTAREMSPERLALRRLIAVEEAASNLSRSLHELHDVCPVCEEPEGEHYEDCLSGALHEALSVPEPIQGRAYPDLLAHIDAITADRDEARQEVAALRAQRDEIRDAHRVEVSALAEQRDDAKSEAAWATERAKGAEAERDALIKGLGFVAEVEALTARLEAAERERDEAQRVLCMIAPERDVVPPRLESAGPTKAGRDAAGWIITSAVRVLFMEMELSPPEKRNRLTIGIQTHDGKGQKYNLTLAKDEWESVMETQRDAARRERDALVVERDAAEAKLAALVAMHDAREERGWDTQSVADFAEALVAARGEP